MNTDALRPAGLGSLVAVVLSLVIGLVALPALPDEVRLVVADGG